MEKFKLSENIDPNKVFIINHSELEGRLDSFFYINRPDFHNTIRLSKIAKIKGGKRIPKDANYSDIDTPNLYLRVTDIDESTEFNYLNFKSISDELYEKLKRYEVFENELIISIAGTVGKTKVVKNIPDKKRVILTENCVKILTNSDILPQYLNIVLQTNFLQKQIELSYIQTTIPKLGIDKILGLKIPQIPPLEIQQQIVDLYEKAYAEKQQKEAEAQKLLDSIDDYLLGELGITLPKEDEHLLQNTDKNNIYNLDNDNPLVKNGRLFLTNLSEVTGKRIDPDYNSKYFYCLFQSLNNSIYPFERIKKYLKAIKTGTTPNQKLNAFTTEKEIPFLRNTNLKKYEINIENTKYIRTKYKDFLTFSYKDEVIMCIAGTIGISSVNIYDIPISINQNVSSLRFSEEINPFFISYWFNTNIFLSLAKRASSVATILYLNNDNLKSLPIPIPPLQKQSEIATHISQIRNKANILKQEGKEILEQAKQEVEQMILGN